MSKYRHISPLLVVRISRRADTDDNRNAGVPSVWIRAFCDPVGGAVAHTRASRPSDLLHRSRLSSDRFTTALRSNGRRVAPSIREAAAGGCASSTQGEDHNGLPRAGRCNSLREQRFTCVSEGVNGKPACRKVAHLVARLCSEVVQTLGSCGIRTWMGHRRRFRTQEIAADRSLASTRGAAMPRRWTEPGVHSYLGAPAGPRAHAHHRCDEGEVAILRRASRTADGLDLACPTTPAGKSVTGPAFFTSQLCLRRGFARGRARAAA
jgi:hypothetical protein